MEWETGRRCYVRTVGVAAVFGLRLIERLVKSGYRVVVMLPLTDDLQPDIDVMDYGRDPDGCGEDRGHALVAHSSGPRQHCWHWKKAENSKGGLFLST
jgi:hypothetical protein